MTKLLVTIAGFVAGGVIVTGTAVAYGTTNASASTGMTKLTIQHVQKGCHGLQQRQPSGCVDDVESQAGSQPPAS